MISRTASKLVLDLSIRFSWTVPNRNSIEWI